MRCMASTLLQQAPDFARLASTPSCHDTGSSSTTLVPRSQTSIDLFNYLLRQRIIFIAGYLNDKVSRQQQQGQGSLQIQAHHLQLQQCSSFLITTRVVLPQARVAQLPCTV